MVHPDTGVAPVAASTVVLLREHRERLEVFMMRRAVTMAFAPGMYVFPGGRLDAQDADTPVTDYPVESDAPRASTDPAGMRALVACAIREVGEETGVVLGPSDLTLLDHWVTPSMASRRFDVRFFASTVPAGQDPIGVGTEMDHTVWIEPLVALAEFEVDRMPMLRPTTRVLELLAAHDRVDDVIATARARRIRPKLPVLGADPAGDWSIVDHRTGEVLESEVPPPRYWEGMP
jgi:8-oxo-dGTP pyrophosphatase MutT (NUDIX family)